MNLLLGGCLTGVRQWDAPRSEALDPEGGPPLLAELWCGLIWH